MIRLQLNSPHWVKDEGDDPADQCAHGRVDFVIDGQAFVSESDGDWTVSAAALFLLRTVAADHAPGAGVTSGNQLFPCCGFSIYPTSDGGYPCAIIGCPNGVDPSVRHAGDTVTVALGERKATLSRKAWASAVHDFASRIEAFYGASQAKQPIEDDEERRGWELFWMEWASLKEAALAVRRQN